MFRGNTADEGASQGQRDGFCSRAMASRGGVICTRRLAKAVRAAGCQRVNDVSGEGAGDLDGGRGTTPKAPVPNRGSRRPTPIPTPPEQPRWRAEEVICPITFRGSWRSPGSSGTIGGGAHDRSRDVLVRSSRKNSSRASSASRISALRAARQTPHSRRCSCGRRLPIRPHRVLRYRGASVRRRVFRPRVHPPAQDQRGRGARHRRHPRAAGSVARRL